MTVLHVSILFRATECVAAIEAILRDMAEPDRIGYVNQLDGLSHTALDYAVSISPDTVIDALIRSGAEFDNHDKLGFTPLMNACHLGRDEAIHCLIGHGANVTATNNFNQSALENIMMGDSKSKHSLLKRLAPRANQDQLNRALLHTFNSDKEFVGVLVECGAEAQYLGLSEDVVPIHSVDPQSSTHVQQDSELLVSESVAESRTSRTLEPQSRNSSIDSTERDLVNEGENDAHDDDIFRMMGALAISDGHRRVDAWCYIGTGCFSIMRIGPLETCKYVFEKEVYGNTGSLQNLSDSQNRISNITFTDETGYVHRRYGWENIE
ncbi:hypothetical protein N7451_012478 [Penicillium sp. IBT 35674x]|nr:hypothetical protein N7451_012478 [Penicillium sp. IBT 35674x]